MFWRHSSNMSYMSRMLKFQIKWFSEMIQLIVKILRRPRWGLKPVAQINFKDQNVSLIGEWDCQQKLLSKLGLKNVEMLKSKNSLMKLGDVLGRRLHRGLRLRRQPRHLHPSYRRFAEKPRKYFLVKNWFFRFNNWLFTSAIFTRKKCNGLRNRRKRIKEPWTQIRRFN